MKTIEIQSPEETRTVDLEGQSTVRKLIRQAFGENTPYQTDTYRKSLNNQRADGDSVVTEKDIRIEIWHIQQQLHGN